MKAKLIDGKAIAAAVRERVRTEVAEYADAHGGRTPGLATVLVGEDPASEIYVRNKHRACEEVGMRSLHHALPSTASEDELLALVARLNAEDEVDGILVQLPVPEQIDPEAVVAAIDPGKDVDGLTPTNAGLLASGAPGLVPCTPAGSCCATRGSSSRVPRRSSSGAQTSSVARSPACCWVPTRR
jgi:methylenetetrahydrofolate dehydrogenase (NADP+)/methenyltetrahydrofolate cyclohydrolase